MTSETLPRIKMPLASWLLVGSVLVAIVGSYTLAQSQIAEHDKRIPRLEARDEQSRIDYAAVRELLLRIDERTTEMKRQMERNRP